MHTLKTDGDLYVTATLIPVNRIICQCKQVSYGDIRMAMVKGARTVEDIQEMTGAGTECGNCLGDIKKYWHWPVAAKCLQWTLFLMQLKMEQTQLKKLEKQQEPEPTAANAKLFYKI